MLIIYNLDKILEGINMKMRGKQANTVGRRFKGFYAFVTLIVLVSNFVLPIHQLVLYADETSPTTGPTAATTANDKVTISNVKFDKSTVYEYYGLNIVVSFDWEGKGLQKGDTLITPMSEAFDSITKTVNYKFSDGNGNELGTMTLDYNHREIRTTFTADMDPQRIYSGTIRIGTYINRNFFTELDSTKTIRIPIPHGDPIEIPLRVKFESYIPGYDIGKTYVNAVEQILSKDQKHAEVLWHGLVNVKHLTMKDLALYASPKLIERVYRVGSMPTGEAAKPENRVNLVYNTAQSHPFTMEPDSFGVFEAETTYESMGYIKGKRLEYGKDYKIIPGIPGDKNGYIFHLIGDYATTDKSIIMEGKALYDNLPVDSTGIGVSQETFVTGNAAISYFDNYGNLQTGDYNAVVNVTDSDVTNISVNDENKETGSVTVVYVTDTGKTLAQEEYVQQNQPLGTPYQTEKRTFEGYVFKKMAENSASPSGEVTSGRKTVIYMYTQEQKGNVDVKYIDLYTGNELTTKAVEPDADDVYRDGKVRELFAEPQTVGTPYETIKHNFKGYRFVRMGNLSAEPSGVVTKEEKHVIYMYEPIVNGIVDVTYIDIDTGQPISVLSNETKKDGTTRLVTKGDVGTNYATIEETFPGYTFVRMGVNSAPATGEVLEKIDQHVIYAYRKTGSVDVKYVDEQGNELPGGEVKSIKTNAPVGESYTTEQKTFTGYTFKGMDKTSSPTEGKVIEGTQHVIYVYTKIPEAKTGSVDVKFVDKTTGEIIEGTSLEVVKDDVPVGEGYYTTPKDLTDKGYQFVGVREGSDDPAGLIVEGTKHVVYEYEKIPEPIVKKGSVDVKYVDRATGEVLPFDEAALTTIKDNVPEGEGYNTAKKDFSGYTFAGMTTNSAAANGTVVADTTLHVIYAYDKIPEVKTGSVDVKFVDKTTGEIIEGTSLEVVKDDVPVGEGYYTTPKDLTDKGYQFVGVREGSDDPAGLIVEGTKHVVYEYEKIPEPIVKKGSVDVKYVDRATGEVLPFDEAALTTIKDNVPEGEGYNTAKKDFSGYTFAGMTTNSAAANGTVVADTTLHVIYAYDKIPEPVVKHGSVDVKYVDEQGNPLPGGELTNIKTNAPVGESYKTEDKTFRGYTFKGMHKDSSPTEGKVIEGKQHVIYVYSKNPDPEAPKVGSVDVKYVDEQGNPLPGGELTNIKTNAPVGESYKTEDKTFRGYTFKGMHKDSSPTEGKVIEGKQHVIYVYSKNPDPEAPKVGSVDVVYLAEDGTILKATEVIADKQPVDTPYQTETLNFAGYSFQCMGAASANPTGKVTEAMQHVVYIYRKNPVPVYGNVDVTHKLTDGTILVPTQKVSEQDLAVGTEYATEELKDAQYRFVGMDKNSDAASGIVSEGMKHVIYLYEKVEAPVTPTGSVDAIYVTENGKILEPANMIQENAQIGTNYQTTQKEFAGYEYVRMGTYSATPTGKVMEGLQHVIYIYREVQAPKFGSITVKYVDKNGQELPGGQESFVAKDEEIGTEYVTEEKTFDGYHFLGMDKNSYPATGIVTEGTKQVIYVYEKDPVIPEVKYGDVDVTYVDEQGNVLPGGETMVIKKYVPVGEIYETAQKEFEGYTFKAMDANSAPDKGKVVEGVTHVIYVYQKVTPAEEEHKGSVDVTYVDESGNPIPGGQTTVVKDNVPVGEKYTTDEKRFDGYVLVGLQKDSAPAKGTVIEGEQHVIYVYKKNKVNAPTPSKVTPPKINNRGNVTVKTTPSKVVSNQNASQLPKAGSQAVNPIVALCCLMMSLGVGFVTRMINKKSRGKY